MLRNLQIILMLPPKGDDTLKIMISEQLCRLTSGVLVHSAQLAFVENAPGTQALLEDLTSLFRYLSSEEKMIPLSRELKALDQYIHLQQIRFPGRFDFFSKISDQTEGIYIDSGSLLSLLDSALTALLDNDQSHFILRQAIEGVEEKVYTLRLSTNLYANIIHKMMVLPREI